MAALKMSVLGGMAKRKNPYVFEDPRTGGGRWLREISFGGAYITTL